MALKTEKVDFLKTENTSQHNTNDYDNPNLILRRGQEFHMKITFDRELTANDKVTLQFTTGSLALPSNGTLVLIDVGPVIQTNQWSALIRQRNNKEYLVAVSSPATAIVGKYMLSIITGKGIVYPLADCTIYLLCNPWCKDDTVYMPSEDGRKEYVLKDTGYIYVGIATKITAKPWNFGQYEAEVLDCCMFLLDHGQLKPEHRRDPVILTRKLSALVNSNDDRGVLTGNWSGNYSGGFSPTSWTGSSVILQKYYKSKRSVMYGQCWVFSGILTTVLRCLGIPARSVTNFNSAHDTGGNLKVDVYLNEKGEILEDLCSDSVWNFHVWNDAWMKRPDLPKGYDGWQAVDATPQELSQGVYECGPCSLAAVKNGDVYLPYDGKFVFAEINADRICWLVKDKQGDEPPIQIRQEKSCIGECISTKTVNMNVREDITVQYKHPEGSPEERETFQKACSFLNSGACLVSPEPPPYPPAGTKLQIQGDKELIPGNPLSFTVSIENETNEAKSLDITIGCQLQAYTGKVIASVASIKQSVQVPGKKVAYIPVTVASEQYMKSVIMVEDEAIFRINAITENKETQEKTSDSMAIAFTYPPIKVEMPETAKINEDFSCTFTFKNTLSIQLDKCQLHVEGLSMFKLETFDEGDIKPGGIFRSKIICAPRRPGEKKIVAKLISSQIKGISVEKTIIIIN
ncbi:hypothetical protein XENTR_v10016294 [Xenopus tropicalis]|uniref:protein-glutamine gamma-glutamyltransferase n=1 Tax=Xenopus tropicalis TaxID=8364 RepID=F7EB11_XENTR|nr:protein-glutamine gamma-glutamyltransferase 4 [Xenopus tropicalis]KAE8596954.1 hypothetical protein XENTR_v10016294 [Xenopus tropicalis]|eukprot:XP_002937794.2 PREDICTED: protein-glutamine gamma-glutamyltransferase 4 [Xenopus tropicalis]